MMVNIAIKYEYRLLIISDTQNYISIKVPCQKLKKDDSKTRAALGLKVKERASISSLRIKYKLILFFENV